MILALEILLTISAWRKGWRGRALLPLGICMGLAFTIGVSAGAAGATEADISGACFILDILALTALGVMNAKAPHKLTVSDATPAVGEPEQVKNVQS